MKTPYFKIGCLLAACAAVAMGSCTTKNEAASLEISKLVAPTSTAPLDAAGAAASCSYLAGTNEYTFQVFNTGRDFRMGIVIVNNLQNNSNSNQGRLNTNDWIATQAITTYEPTDGSSVSIAQQITPVEGMAVAGGSLVTSAVLIPASVAAKLAGVTSVRLHTRVEGRLLDGSTVSTNEYLPVAIPTSSDTDTSTCVAGGN